LCWNATPAAAPNTHVEGISITNVGDNQKLADCTDVSPASSTSYKLTARNGHGLIEGDTTVTVVPTTAGAHPPSGAPPYPIGKKAPDPIDKKASVGLPPVRPLAGEAINRGVPDRVATPSPPPPTEPRNECDISGIKSQLAQAPGSEGLLTRLANCTFKAGQFTESVSAWTRLIELDDGNAAYYDLRGLAKLQNDSVEGARKDFLTATQKDSRTATYWADLARADEQLGNPQDAAKEYDKAIRFGAKTRENYLGLARAYDKMGARDLAAEARNLAAKL
jgi:tetratricopeptide (TPR) repeat protein